MKKIALTIEEMEALKKLGADVSKASMHWQYLPTIEDMKAGKKIGDEDLTEAHLFVSDGLEHEYPAFTLQDMLSLLPVEMGQYSIFIKRAGIDNWKVGYEDSYFKSPYIYICRESLISAVYGLYKWYLNNWVELPNKDMIRSRGYVEHLIKKV